MFRELSNICAISRTNKLPEYLKYSLVKGDFVLF